MKNLKRNLNAKLRAEKKKTVFSVYYQRLVLIWPVLEIGKGWQGDGGTVLRLTQFLRPFVRCSLLPENMENRLLKTEPQFPRTIFPG